MSPRKPRYSSPGKVFLLGEYAVLAGERALVAATSPRFELAPNSSDVPPPFHPDSPAGRLLKKLGSTLSLEFRDPYEGQGGFGASTAQFLLSHLAVQGRTPHRDEWFEVWSLYRGLLATEPLIPSGADLVAQWCGGVTCFNPVSKQVEDFSKAIDWSNLLVFSAAAQPGRKVRTHDHLQTLQLSSIPASELRVPLNDGLEALRRGDAHSFGAALSGYAEVLRKRGFEADATFEDRRALRTLPGVLGVKGAGALQADSIIMLLDPEAADRAKIIQAAEARGLVLVADGLNDFAGVQCHPS